MAVLTSILDGIIVIPYDTLPLMGPHCHTISFTALPGISHHEHTLHNLVQDIARICAVMKQLHSIVRFLIPTILIALFFYFFGLSTLRKGVLKDVVEVSCKFMPYIKLRGQLI